VSGGKLGGKGVAKRGGGSRRGHGPRPASPPAKVARQPAAGSRAARAAPRAPRAPPLPSSRARADDADADLQLPIGTAAGHGTPRVTSLVVDALAHLLERLLRFDGPADATMARFFRDDHRIGARDRSVVAEGAFHALRHLATLRWMLQSAPPERAPRLAALVTLARQHGLAALDPRIVRNDERAIRSALAFDVARAPGAVRAEVPLWLYQRIEAQYPDAQALLAASTQAAPLDLRVNTLKADRAAVLAELASVPGHRSIDAQPTRYSPDGIRLADKLALMRWPMYLEGRIEVQDEGSQLIARLVAPRRGEMIVDFCAGAGGKTLALGSLMRSTGRLYAFDIHARRLAGLAPRLKRSGLSNVHPAAIATERDPRAKRLAGKIDRVLVDAPCSGSGTLRRNPDLKWRFDDLELARLNDVQANVLRAGARLVRPGGRLVYATCSLLAQENQALVTAFLAEHPQFVAVPAADVLAAQGIQLEAAARFAPWLVMLPHLHGTDGFFGAVLERRA
jgi:16S rRNA (cytosine967-C5)-methyltransferase